MDDIIILNGIEYVVNKKKGGSRAIIILDRGWIFAGDVERSGGRIYLTRVVWVFGWKKIGLDGAVESPLSEDVTIKKFKDIDFPEDVEIFAIPVDDDWGLP